MESLADFNNNPGNLRPPAGVTYKGQIGIDDKGFAIFDSKDAGETALKNDINVKIKRGINTPEKFIDIYSPKGPENSEESRENYKLWLAHKLGLRSTTDPFPENATDNIFSSIRSFEGGTWNQPAPDASAAQPGAEVRATDEGERLPAQGTADVPGASDDIKPFLGIVGGGTGLGVSTSLETTKKVAPLLPNIMNAMVPGRQVNPNLPQSRMSLQRYLNSQIAPNLRLPLRDLEREITALQRVTTPGAPGTKIRTMSEVQMALDAIKEVEAKTVTKPMVRQVPGRPGVFENTGMFTSSTTPGRPGVDLTQYEVRGNSGPIRAAVGRELTTAGEVGRAVLPSVARVGVGGLGAAGAVMSGYDAYELKKKIDEDKRRGITHETTLGMTPDEWRLMSKGAATVGGGLSMLPFGVTQLGGLALSAPELVWSGYDWLQNRDNNPPAQSAPAPANPLSNGTVMPQ